MAHFEPTHTGIQLKFSSLEALGALRTRATVPWEDVASIEVAPDPWSILRGLRFGTAIPWVILLGVMFHPKGSDVVALYKRKPAVVVHCKPGTRYHRLIATVDPPEELAAELREAMPAQG